MNSIYLSDPFEEYGLFSLLLSTTCTILFSIIFAHYIYNDSLKSKHTSCIGSGAQPHSLITSCCLLFFTLYSLQMSILSIYWTLFAKPNHSFHAPWCIGTFNQYWFFSFGKIAMYWFWFVRIHQLFKDSVFAVSPRKLKVMAFVFTLPICILSFAMSYGGGIQSMGYVVDPHNDWSSINSFEDCHILSRTFQTPTIMIMQVSVIALYSISEIVYTVVVIRLFVSKILQLAAYCHGVSLRSGASSTTVTSNIEEQKMFLELSMKTSFLMILTMCTNYITFIKFSIKLPSFVMLFDVLSNFMSVYLSFSFASKYYDMLFSTWHNQCNSICVKVCYLCCAPKALKILKAQDQSMISINMKQEMEETSDKKKETVKTSETVNKHTTLSSMNSVASNTATVVAIST